MDATTVGKVLNDEGMSHIYGEPWMQKADPDTKLFKNATFMNTQMLGFDHMLDVLKQDLAEGRIRPEQLNKISIEQAVRRVHQYDQDRKKAMAQTALKQTEGMPVHKEYPEGYKWIELTKPDTVNDDEIGHLTVAKPQGRRDFAVLDKNTNHYVSTGHKSPEEAINHIKDIAREKRLSEALKYEGDTMGHCVGGYCPDVASGHSRIFSLRDAKNEPHVTIEVQPKRRSASDADAPVNVAEYQKWISKELPPVIKQIKGKGNAKPKKDYIPFVQDFVKSGNWSNVGDIHNAEMRDMTRTPNLKQWLEQKQIPHHRYVTEQEYGNHEGDFLLDKLGTNTPQQKAQGGTVNAFDYENPAHVENVANIVSRHKDFNQITDAAKHLGDMLSTGNWKYIEDPRMQAAIKQAGHKGYYVREKEGKQSHVIKKADGGAVQPSLAQMKLAIASQSSPVSIKDIGLNEALDIDPKVYIPPEKSQSGMPAPGGVAMPSGMPIGGIDMNKGTPGQQLMPMNQSPMLPDPTQKGALPGAQPSPMPTGFGPGQSGQASPIQGGNILQMTPQGQKMSMMSKEFPPMPGQTPSNMAKGGSAKVKFGIAPPVEKAKEPDEFTFYDHDNPSVPSLSKAFDEAIKHHLSLSQEDRKKNSIRASEKVGDIIGRTSTGKVKDLLGKNEKLLKSEKGIEGDAVKLPDGRGVETTGLALSPAYRQGKFDTCPNHHSCKEECLGKTSGNYFKLGGGQNLNEFKGPRLNSLKKTHAFLHDPHSFAVKLHDEISDAKAIAAQNGNHLGVRLNVLSDINPRVHKSIIHAHPDVTFYDYTKNNTDPIASNHHYTYSSTGVSQPGVENEHTNWKSMRRRLDQGDNVAMAFSHKDHLPEHVHDQETGKKYRVVNGDTHDFRPLDLQPEGEDGVIIGLKNKKATGKMHEAHVDSHGFFVHYDPQLKMTTSEKTGSPVYARDKKGNSIPQNKTVNIQPQRHKMIPISNDDGENV